MVILEDDKEMASRLVAYLRHEEDMRCTKRRWILTNLSEDLTAKSVQRKRRKLEFLMDKYVPLSLAKEEKSIIVIRTNIQKNFNDLHDDATNLKVNSKSLHCPLLKTGSILKDPKSRQTDFDIGSVKIFTESSEMPLSPLEAAHLGFAFIEKLPVRNLQQVNMALSDFLVGVSLFFKPTHHPHGATLDVVKRKANRILSVVTEEHPLPLCIEKALRVVSLSMRDLYGNDGGIHKVLVPLNPEIEALEDDFLRALSHLETMKFSELEKVYHNGLGLPAKNSKRKQPVMYRRTLRRLLVDSLHWIYSGTLPEPVTRLLTAIRADAVKNAVEKENRKQERIEAELEAILCLCGQVEGMMWECLELLNKAGNCISERDAFENLNAPLTAANEHVDRLNADRSMVDERGFVCPEFDSSSLNSQMAFHGNYANGNLGAAQGSESVEKEMKPTLMHNESLGIAKNLMDIPEVLEEVERAAEEVATAAYTMLGCFVEAIRRHDSGHLEDKFTMCLQMGLEATHNSGILSKERWRQILSQASGDANSDKISLVLPPVCE